MKKIFVTGTDTGVGKTVVSACLALAWRAGYWKPVQTGMATGDDDTATVVTLAALQSEHVYPPAYALRAPLSPHAAAELEGVRITMEAIALRSGTQIVHIPYPGSPQAMTAVIRGDVQMACLPAISVTPHAGSDKVKILAVSTAKRSALLPDIPTLKESGIDVEADAWMGLIAPAKVPDAIVAKIAREVAAVITAPDIREKLSAQLMEPIPTTPAEFRARIDADLARWAPVIRAANIRIN